MMRQLRAAKIDGWEAEYQFAPPRRWRFDFAWPKERVALEVEGGVFAGGRHTRGVGFEKDCEKYSRAAILRWVVIRVTARQIREGLALTWIEEALAVRRVKDAV